jgi:hypothetical protein
MILTEYSYSEDTLFLKENTILINNNTNYSLLSKIKLLESKKYFYGYLIIQIDSSSHLKKFKTGGEIFNTLTYWVENLDSIDNDNCRYYFNPLLGLLEDGERSYDNGHRDDLSTFIFYYNLFNYNNRPNKISYLYPYSGQFLSSNIIFNTNIWNKNNTKVNYIIYETNFYTAVLYFEEYFRKAFIPISDIKTFATVQSKLVLEKGFSKSKLVIIGK